MSQEGLALAILSAVFNGSFAAFGKLEAASLVHPFIFNVYLSFGVFLSSCIVIPFLPALGSPPLVCPLGLLAGLLFVGASSLSFLVVASGIGLSTGQGVWSGSAILVAFLWGTLGPAPIGNPVVSLPLSLVAGALLLLGVYGIVKNQELGACAAQLLGHELDSTPMFEELLIDEADVDSGDNTQSPSRAGKDEAPPLGPEPTHRRDNQSGSLVAGLAAALLVGVFGGSILVSALPAAPAH
jgi:hypothetical protein